jgi:hypothetical protein
LVHAHKVEPKMLDTKVGCPIPQLNHERSLFIDAQDWVTL